MVRHFWTVLRLGGEVFDLSCLRGDALGLACEISRLGYEVLGLGHIYCFWLNYRARIWAYRVRCYWPRV